MTTAASGAREETKQGRRKRRSRRQKITGVLLAVATMAGATVVVVGGGVDSAEAAEFGTIPPPPTDTLCETDRPAAADVAINGLDWASPIAVTIPLMSVDGDKTSLTYGDKSTYTGDYTYSVVLDNTGDPFDPDVDNHPSYSPMESSSPIVLTGGGSGSTISVDLPRSCRYVVSVRADGHDLGGSWIRIEADGTYVANDVDMMTNDRLPFANLIVRAFHDFAQVNAQFDIGEPGIEGFDVVVYDGGEIAVDYFENPICTKYVIGGGTNPLALDEGDYVAGEPVIDTTAAPNCLTDEDGFLTINFLTAGWYEIEIIPPDTSDWIQTTTIEGTRIIEAWLLPDDAGVGGEFIGDVDAGTFQAFGFVSPTLHPDPAIAYEYPFIPDALGGDVTGCVFNGQLFPSATGVQTVVQNGTENLDGTSEPLLGGYIALNDVGNHDSMLDVVETDDNGCFRFVDVPQGTYQITIWDYDLLYIIGFYNVTVDVATISGSGADLGFNNGQVDMGDLFILRWFGWSSGYVFYDSGITKGGVPITATDPGGRSNLKDGSTQAAGNGVRDCLGQNDPGFNYDAADPATCEAGIPLQDVVIRDRDGSIAKGAVTDLNGYYEISNIWGPMFRYQVIEVGAGALDFTGHSTHDQFDRNKVASQGNCPANVEDILDDPAANPDADLSTPGIQTLEDIDCQPAVLGGGLLLASVFQQGKRNEIDFGKLSYLDPNAPNGFFAPGGDGHGGIAGGVINTVTRAEWAGSLSAAEDNEPGVPGATVRLLGYDGAGCTAVDPETGATGADNADCYNTVLDEVDSDSYQHPGAERNGQTCTLPQRDGTPYALINPYFESIGDNCVEAWLLGSHTKDGAWDGGFAFTGMSPGFYVVELELPPGYQIVKENDLNTGEGNEFVPSLPPSGCVGGYHYAQLDSGYASPFDAFSDPDGAGAYNGAAPVRLCDRRLVRVQPFRNAGVDMMVMTEGMDRTWESNYVHPSGPSPEYPAVGVPVDPYTITGQSWQSVESVPMPGRFFGLVLDDLNMTADQNALTFGEQRGVAGIPIGVYDHTGNLVTTFWTDENGHYEVLLPSTFSINRPTPGGLGYKMYNFVVNDPGPTGDNWGFDPGYLTNPVVLNTLPGKMTKADTPVLTLAAGPCSLPTATPQLIEVNAVHGTSGSLPTDYTIDGLSLAGASVFLTPLNPDGTLDVASAVDATPHSSVTTIATPSDPGSFYDEMIVDLAALDTAVALDPGPYQVSFSDGTPLSETPRNGITFHVLGTGYDLDVWTVTTPATADEKVIQIAIDDAIADATDVDGDLVVVSPGTYRESIVIHDDVVLQGFGPGGIIGVGIEIGPIGQIETAYSIFTGTVISPYGALLDNRMFEPWETVVSGLTWDGNQGVEVGPAFQVLLESTDVTVADNFQIDGFGVTTARANNGALFVNGHADGLLISNNGFQANNASEGGGAISLGTHSLATFEANLGGTGAFTRTNGRILPAAGLGELDQINGRSDADNDGVVIRDNRILQNGGIALAGAVGIFNGNDGYQFINNDVCGNYAAEYGGGLSHFGLTLGGVIAGNAFQNNEAFDEGGALLIGSEIALTAGDLGLGSGDVTVDSNQFLYNLSGDDGGAIMALHPLDSPLRIANNIIANNIATDVGGGIHLADSSAATIVHNTIANNVSTNSAEDAGGFSCIDELRVTPATGTNTCPRAGGLTTQPHSASFASTVSPQTFSDADLRNNIFWNNKAGVVFKDVVGDEGNLVQLNAFDLPDLGVYDGITDKGIGPSPMVLNPEFSTLTVPYGAALTNFIGDPLLTLEIAFEAIKSLGAPQLGQVANVNHVFPATIPIEATDYHLASAASPAVDLGLLGVEAFDIDREDRPFIGPIGDNTAPDSGADEIGAGTPSLAALMFFSTTRNADANIGVADTDAQAWSATGIATVLTGAAVAPVGDRDDIDALQVLSATEFLVSFRGNGAVVLPAGPAGALGTFSVLDEDIVHYDATTDTWSQVLDGSLFSTPLTGWQRDIRALHRLADGSYLVSFAGFATLATQSGTIGVPDEDIVRMVPVMSTGGMIIDAYFEPYFSGASLGLDGTAGGDIDGLSLINGGDTLLLSMRGTNEIGDLTVHDEDVIACGGVTVGLGGLVTCEEGDFLYFDGSAEGLAANNDVDAVSGPIAG